MTPGNQLSDTGRRGRMAGRWSGRALAIGGLLFGLTCHADPADDPWVPGYRSGAWDRIHRIQSCPLTVKLDTNDLKALCADLNLFVRAAAAFAIGRLQTKELTPSLIPLLDDDAEIVRRSAFWALLRMEDDQIKAPLLKVLSSWPDVDHWFPGTHNYFYLFRRIGLPHHLARLPLEKRREWVKKLDVAAWDVRFDDSQSPISPTNGRIDITVYPALSHWDAGHPVKLTVEIKPVGCKKPLKLRLTDGTGDWFAVGDKGDVSRRDMYEWRMHFPKGLAELDHDIMLPITPDACRNEELSLSPTRKPLPPGVYLFCSFRSMCPVLVRVRRSKAFERQIPDLIERIPAREAVETLGQQRVTAAVPALIRAFEDRHCVFAVAKALSEIGDPSAISVLLDNPLLREEDVIGDTSRALSAFAERAFPYFEERIHRWRRELRAGKAHGLAIALRLLGYAASEQARSDRLEIMQTLVAEADGSRTRESGEKQMVLRAALAGAAYSHPQEVVDVIWGCADRPDLASALVTSLRRVYPEAVSPETVKPIASQLWVRATRDPGTAPQLREALTRLLKESVPELLSDPEQGIASEREALYVLESVRGKEGASRNRVAAKVREFAERSPSIRVKLGLAQLYFDLKKFDECEGILKEIEGAFSEDWQRVPAFYCLGEILTARGDLRAGREYMQKALSLAEPHHCYGTVRNGIMIGRIEHRLKIVETMLATPALRFQEHGMSPSVGTHRYLEVAGGRAFYIDSARRLCSWSPLTQQGWAFGIMPQVVRDFMPLDQSRVFVAFLDGSSALYELGERDPIWKRSLALGFDSFLTASPAAIIAANEAGVLHALNPKSGETLWTRRVRGKRWPENWWRSKRGLISLHDDHVLVPNTASSSVTTFEWVDVSTGETQWTHSPGVGIDKVTLSGTRGFLSNRSGLVQAVDLAYGKAVWKTNLGASVSLPYNELEVATCTSGEILYVGMKKTVWGIDGSSGETIWQWDWSPAPGAGSFGGRNCAWPRLRATEEGVFLVFRWEADQRPPGHERTDVILFSKTGEIICRAASPQTAPYFADNIFLAGDRLVFRKNCRWEVWQAALDTNEQ